MNNEYFRGDTFVFPFSFQNDNNEEINFEVGDIIKCGAKKSIYNKEYALYKEIIIETEVPEIQIKFLPEETKKLKLGKHILEVELTRNGDVETPFQQEFKVKGDVII